MPKTAEERREYYKKWYYNNLDKVKAYRDLSRIKRKKLLAEYFKKWKDENPTYYRESHLKQNYGLSIEKLGQMVREQNNKCAICEEVFIESPNVDHCHRTNAVRGLLCKLCNSALGFFKDNEETLQRAIDYLRKSRS